MCEGSLVGTSGLILQFFVEASCLLISTWQQFVCCNVVSIEKLYRCLPAINILYFVPVLICLGQTWRMNKLTWSRFDCNPFVCCDVFHFNLGVIFGEMLLSPFTVVNFIGQKPSTKRPHPVIMILKIAAPSYFGQVKLRWMQMISIIINWRKVITYLWRYFTSNTVEICLKAKLTLRGN